MTPKVAFDLLCRRLSQWSTPATNRSQMGRSYRTEFQRFLWSAIFLTIYLMFAFYNLSGDQEGSADNSGIWALLLFGIFFCALGAYFAPGWSALTKRYTASGRRHAAEKKRQRDKDYAASRSRSRSERSAHRSEQKSEHRSERSSEQRSSHSSSTSASQERGNARTDGKHSE